VFNAFSASTQTLINAIPRPLLSSNTANFSPPQTFTQVRWITYSNLIVSYTTASYRDVIKGYGTYWDIPGQFTFSRYTSLNASPEGPYGVGMSQIESVNFQFFGTVVKDFDDPQGRIPDTNVTVSFPWLPSVSTPPEWNSPANDADFIAYNRFSTAPPLSCFYNGSPIYQTTGCAGARSVSVFQRNSELQFSQARYLPINTLSGADFSFNHPFCTRNVPLTKETPVNFFNPSLGTSGNVFSAIGTVFSCEMFRYFNEHGVGSVMPVVISYSR
jgi:hypothetical protein